MFIQNPAGIEAHVDVAQAVLNAGKKCEELGHEVEYIPNPYDDRILLDFLVYYAGLTRLMVSFGRLLVHRKFRSTQVEPFTHGLAKFYTRSILHSPSSFMRLRRFIRKEQEDLYRKYDVLLGPTVLSPVPKLGFLAGDQSFISLVMRINNYVNFTILQNASGAPAITLPLGKCSSGLPIGPQFAAKVGDEKTLLQLAFELEESGAFMKY